MNRRRRLFVLAAVSAIATVSLAAVVVASPSQQATGRDQLRSEGVRDGFVPAAARGSGIGRYFVVMKAPSVADQVKAGGAQSKAAEVNTADAARASQSAAISQAKSMGGDVVFRYDVLVNGFSAQLSQQAASALAARSDVASVQPVSVVHKENETSVPFIGAPEVWHDFGARGQGMNVAVVDTGVDYTHANFGGPGTVSAYESNNPNYIETDPDTGEPNFPTDKVTKGYDFVGSNYDVVDDDLGGNNEDPTNDIPRPDPDPLDRDGHGSHTAGTCCGLGVPGQIGKGVAPKANVWAVKVWDEGNSTDDVLVRGYEYAMDPNGDGDTSDAADVISFSGGVDYGTLNSVEARAAQRVVDLGTVFVASAGNSGNQATGGSAYITGTPANARGVISVAASIDQFVAQTLTVDTPPTPLPDGGLMVPQDWAAPLDTDITDQIIDAREFDEPADPENPAPSDRMLCDSTPAGSFDGHIALVFKGATGGGDCTGSEKVFRAQEMGASAVVLWNGFGGLPSALGPGDFVDQITIPAAMISTDDSETLGDTISPDAASGNFNGVATTVTLHADPSVIPGHEDSMTDFTSEGPARLTNDLKPDISAPGFDIKSTAVGTGTEGAKLSGTSMAAPHVSGVATLLRQIHPTWKPDRIKAVLMNQATRDLKNNDLSAPVSATVMGAGRVQADESAKAVSVAEPGSLSYGLQHLTGTRSEVRTFTVKNVDKKSHTYTVDGEDRYWDFDPAMTDISISLDNNAYGPSQTFTLAKNKKQKVYVSLQLDPSVISETEQENGWYYFHPNMDGTITVHQNGQGGDPKVAWHVAPLAASTDSLTASNLDLGGGPAVMALNGGGAAVDYADLYQLGDTDSVNGTSEEDIVATGARSFTGSTVGDDTPEGVPSGTDEAGGNTWLEFLTQDDEPTETVEFGVQTADVHNTTETEEVDVLVDAGADGVFAGTDDGVDADYLVVKTPDAGGNVCVYDLSQPGPFDECSALYFADYTNYNGNLFGLAVDANAIGVTDGDPISYSVQACTGTFSGDIPGQICDTAGGIDSDTGTYDAVFNPTDPALVIDPQTCKGFWDGPDCSEVNPITVDRGSAGPDEDPSILALFPNNPPAREPTIITTTH
jgi:minor extracellular serine protease Vpr